MGLILPSVLDRLKAPNGSPRLRRDHPMVAGGAIRCAPIALSGGGMRDLYTGAFAMASSHPATIQTRFGPAVVPGAATGNGYYFAPVFAGETWTESTFAAIFKVGAPGGGQGLVGAESTTAGPHSKITINTLSGVLCVAGMFYNVPRGQIPVTIGHTYMAILSYRAAGLDTGVARRSILSVLDLETGVVQSDFGTPTGANTVGTAYNFLTYGSGVTTDRHALLAGAISAKALSLGEQLEVLADPFALWNDHEAGVYSLMTEALSGVVSGSAPTVTGIFKTPVAGSLAPGDNVTVTIKFSSDVTVGGAPTLTFTTGGTATYIGGSGSDELVFGYSAVGGETAANFVVDTINLPSGATIRDDSAQNADLTISGIDQSYATGPTIGPAVSAVILAPSSGTRKAGDAVAITVGFAAAVTVAGGTPTLTLNDGGTATYVSGSGSTLLVFQHTVAGGQNALSLAATAINLPGGCTIRDGSGNDAVLSLVGLNQFGPAIDTTAPGAPVITSAALVGVSAQIQGTAEAGATIAVYDAAASLGSAVANGSGAWSFTTAALTLGNHSFTATATDAAGNLGAASAAFALTVGVPTTAYTPPPPGDPLLFGSGHDQFAPDGLVAGARYQFGEVVTIAPDLGTILRGTVLGMITASRQYAPCVKTATDGSQTPIGICLHSVDATGDGAFTFVAMAGAYKESALIIDASWTLRDMVDALIQRRGMFIGK